MAEDTIIFGYDTASQNNRGLNYLEIFSGRLLSHALHSRATKSSAKIPFSHTDTISK